MKITSCLLSILVFTSLNPVTKLFGQTANYEFSNPKTLNQKAWKLRYQNPDSANFLSELALEKAVKLKDQEEQINSFNCLGVLRRNEGALLSSIQNHYKALELSNQLKNDLLIAKSSNLLGSAYNLQGNYKSALKYIQKGLKIRESLGEPGLNLQVSSLINLGNVEKNSGQHADATYHYLKALELSKKLNLDEKHALVLNNLSIIYAEAEDFDLAVDYLRKALEIHTEVGNKTEIGRTYINLANLFSEQGKDSLSLSYYREAESIFSNLNNQFEVAIIQNDLGAFYADKEAFKKAIEYHSKALEKQKNIHDDYGIGFSYLSIGRIYRQTGATQQALNALISCKSISDSLSFADLQIEVYPELINLYFDQKEFVNARNLVDDFLKIRNQISDEQRASIQKEIQNRFKAELLELKLQKSENEKLKIKSQKEVAEQELMLKNLQNKILIISFIASCLLLIVVSVLAWNHVRVQKLKMKNQLDRQNAIKKERQRVGMDLHDWFGATFSSIRFLIVAFKKSLTEKTDFTHIDRALKIIDNANQNAKNIAHNFISGTLFEEGLIAALKNFFYREGHVPEEFLEFHTDGYKNRVSADAEHRLFYIIQELISNARKHAHATKIDVVFTQDEQALIIEIVDDGIGIKDLDKAYSKGFGLSFLEAKLRPLNAKFKIETNSETTESGTSITLIIPTNTSIPS